MASVKTTVNAAQDTVEIFLPKLSGETPTKYVAVNGRAWLIPRGKKVAVPKCVAAVLDRANGAAQAADEYNAEQAKLGETPLYTV